MYAFIPHFDGMSDNTKRYLTTTWISCLFVMTHCFISFLMLITRKLQVTFQTNYHHLRTILKLTRGLWTASVALIQDETNKYLQQQTTNIQNWYDFLGNYTDTHFSITSQIETGWTYQAERKAYITLPNKNWIFAISIEFR